MARSCPTETVLGDQRRQPPQPGIGLTSGICRTAASTARSMRARLATIGRAVASRAGSRRAATRSGCTQRARCTRRTPTPPSAWAQGPGAARHQRRVQLRDSTRALDGWYLGRRRASIESQAGCPKPTATVSATASTPPPPGPPAVSRTRVRNQRHTSSAVRRFCDASRRLSCRAGPSSVHQAGKEPIVWSVTSPSRRRREASTHAPTGTGFSSPVPTPVL